MKTYPNQKIIKVNKEKVTKDFLQISNKNWQEAAVNLTQGEFIVYLYCISNADNYQFALSREDIVENKKLLSVSSYKRAVNGLIEKKYLVKQQGNIYDIYETPQWCQNETKKAWVQNDTTDGIKLIPSWVQNDTTVGSKMNREIDKTDKTDKIDRESINLSAELKVEAEKFHNGVQSATQLLQQGKTEEWIFTAIHLFSKKQKKKTSGMGLFFVSSFQDEVNQFLAKQKEEKEFRQVLDNCTTKEVPPAEVRIVTIDGTKEPRKSSQLIDMDSL